MYIAPRVVATTITTTNIQRINNHIQLKKSPIDDEDEQLDVVFYRDSFIEESHGRWMGNDMSSKQQIHFVFHKYFDPDSTSSTIKPSIPWKNTHHSSPIIIQQQQKTDSLPSPAQRIPL